MRWYGPASWYNLCPTSGSGGGACGTCFSNRSGMAYPNVSGHGPDYSYNNGCTVADGGITQESCGTNLTVYGVPQSSCVQKKLSVPIVDHGPGAACHSDHISCPYYYSYRLIDLTAYSFTAFGGPLSYGIMYVEFLT